MMSAHSWKVVHLVPLPEPPETSWSFAATVAPSVAPPAASEASASRMTASYDSAA